MQQAGGLLDKKKLSRTDLKILKVKRTQKCAFVGKAINHVVCCISCSVTRLWGTRGEPLLEASGVWYLHLDSPGQKKQVHTGASPADAQCAGAQEMKAKTKESAWSAWKRKGWGEDLIAFYNNLLKGHKDNWARLISEVHIERKRCNRQKLLQAGN